MPAPSTLLPGVEGSVRGPHLLPEPPLLVLELPGLLLPHRLQLPLVGPAQALQLSRQVPQEFGPLLPLLHGRWGRRWETTAAPPPLKPQPTLQPWVSAIKDPNRPLRPALGEEQESAEDGKVPPQKACTPALCC